MAQCANPFYEPVPDYMRKLLLLGARFIEGNTGEGSAGSTDSDGEKPDDEEQTTEPKTEDEESKTEDEESDDEESDDEFKSEESKEAVLADLKKERDRRKKLQADHESKVEELTASITEQETAVAERDTTIAQKDAQIHVLQLAITHGIKTEVDLDLLADVADKDKREKLAERLSKAADKNYIISASGTGGGDVGGTVTAGRDLYNERRKK